MRVQTALLTFVLFSTRVLPAQQVFDSHVHLWEGEKSLLQYEAQVKASGIELAGFGGMWFGGPNQALSGHPDTIRASNDAHLALAKKHPEMLPIATVHNRNTGTEKCRADRTSQVAEIANIQRVDSDEHGTLIPQKFSSGLGQKRMALEVLIRSPVAIPTAVDQNSPVAISSPRCHLVYPEASMLQHIF